MGRRNIHGSENQEDDSFIFRKEVYTEDGGASSTETLAIIYQTARYHMAEHQHLKKGRRDESCEEK
jgi:hypothetical protein